MPTTELYAFSDPVVKGTDLVQPVLVGAGQPHGLRASIAQWRSAAQKIVAATEPKALQLARIRAAKHAPDPESERRPIEKPSGGIL